MSVVSLQVIAGLLMTLCTAWCEQARTSSTPEDPVRAYCARVIPGLLERHRTPGLAVAIVRDGEVAWAQGFGVADLESGRRVTPETLFNAASISKVVTAWAVMRLVERGDLPLDEPVEEFLDGWRFPETPHDSRGVTVRRLLSHTAGLSMHSLPAFEVPRPLPSLEQILAGSYTDSMYADGGTRVELVTAPGSEWRYSGGGFVLLQLLLERRTEEPFTSHMERAVLRPLGMEHSRFGWRDSMRARAAVPYDGEGRAYPVYRFTATGGGGLYLSVLDLARFGAAGLPSTTGARGRGVLKPETVESMYAHTALASGEYTRCGLGYMLAPRGAKVREANHDGSNNGWKSLIVSLPDHGRAIALLANSDSSLPIFPELVCAWAELEIAEVLSGCR